MFFSFIFCVIVLLNLIKTIHRRSSNAGTKATDGAN